MPRLVAHFKRVGVVCEGLLLALQREGQALAQGDIWKTEPCPKGDTLDARFLTSWTINPEQIFLPPSFCLSFFPLFLSLSLFLPSFITNCHIRSGVQNSTARGNGPLFSGARALTFSALHTCPRTLMFRRAAVPMFTAE